VSEAVGGRVQRLVVLLLVPYERCLNLCNPAAFADEMPLAFLPLETQNPATPGISHSRHLGFLEFVVKRLPDEMNRNFVWQMSGTIYTPNAFIRVNVNLDKCLKF